MHWDYWRLLTLVSLAGFFGLLFGQMMTFMFLAAFIYALWLQRSWYQLLYWLEKPKKNKSPNAEGVINDVCRHIESMRFQSRARKKKLSGYLKRFQAATSALPDAVVVLGEYGEVEWANLSAQKMLGIKWPKDSHLRMNNLIRDPSFQILIDSSAGTEQVAFVKSPIDSRVELEMKIVNYLDSGRLLIARDMTQTVKLQKMRRDFVANVSHELRTPLTVLRGYLGTFDKHSPQEQWKSALPVMLEQSEKMQVMLHDLLELSQLETGEKPLRHLPIDMSVFLTTLIAEAKELTDYKQQSIELQIDSDLMLLGDRDELHSAVSNLIFNAVKYTTQGCRIDVGWRVTDTIAEIYVNDEGEGIAEHHLERLTERFYRADSGRTQQLGGTGLGLAIVKHVLQRHDAEIKITSDLGFGSQFRCLFPKRRAVQLIEEPEFY